MYFTYLNNKRVKTLQVSGFAIWESSDRGRTDFDISQHNEEYTDTVVSGDSLSHTYTCVRPSGGWCKGCRLDSLQHRAPGVDLTPLVSTNKLPSSSDSWPPVCLSPHPLTLPPLTPHPHPRPVLSLPLPPWSPQLLFPLCLCPTPSPTSPSSILTYSSLVASTNSVHPATATWFRLPTPYTPS